MDDFFYMLIGAGAVFAVLSAGAASYVARLRDEHESTGAPIETIFSWSSLWTNVVVAAWVGVVGMAGVYVAIDIFFDSLSGLRHFSLSAVIGGIMSFLNRATIAIARHRIPEIADAYLKRPGKNGDNE